MSNYYEDAARLLLGRLAEMVPPGKTTVQLPESAIPTLGAARSEAERYRLAWLNARRRAAEEAYAGLRWLEQWRHDLDEKDAEIAALHVELENVRLTIEMDACVLRDVAEEIAALKTRLSEARSVAYAAGFRDADARGEETR